MKKLFPMFLTVACLTLPLTYFFLSGKKVKSQTEKTLTTATNQQIDLPRRHFGLTIDESTIDNATFNTRIIPQLKRLKREGEEKQKPTVRIVLPVKDNTNELPQVYIDIIKNIHENNLGFILAELMDSSGEISQKCFLKNSEDKLDKQLSTKCYADRTEAMYKLLGKFVDIWEIGNEINGDWFGGKQKDHQLRRDIVISQVETAYKFFEEKKISIKQKNERPENKDTQEKIPQTAVTYYFNDDDNGRSSYASPEDSMTRWIRNDGKRFHNVDFVLISYYPDDNFYKPANEDKKPIDLTAVDWVRIFNLIKGNKNFSQNTKFGLGEMGTHCKFRKRNQTCGNGTCVRKEMKDENNPCRDRMCSCCLCSQVKIIKENYLDLDRQIRDEIRRSTLNESDFIGGYFYWFYSPDVINKMSDAETQNNETQKAIIDAYKRWNDPAL